MKQTVYSSKILVFVFLVSTLLFLGVELVAICFLIKSLINHTVISLLALIIIVVFLPFLLLSIFMLNRLGCKITYDKTNKLLIRSGFLCGYSYQINIADIKDIITATFPKETTYFVLIDSIGTKYNGGYKKSFIRIEKNEKNHQFIKQFWDKPIK